MIYEGVAPAFKDLAPYWRPFTHRVKGIGGQVSKVVGKLVGVPVSLGATPDPQAVRSTFYVLDSPGYHWLLGLTFLEATHGAVHCKERLLTFLPHPNAT